jgi:hypothetical protein
MGKALLHFVQKKQNNTTNHFLWGKSDDCFSVSFLSDDNAVGDIFLPNSIICHARAFKRLLLPTLGRPIIATTDNAILIISYCLLSFQELLLFLYLIVYMQILSREELFFQVE